MSGNVSPQRTTAAMTERVRRYASLRTQGLSNSEAAMQLGVTPKTGWRYSVASQVIASRSAKEAR